jgi:hypothetical protein
MRTALPALVVLLAACQTAPSGRVTAGYAQFSLSGQAALESSIGGPIPAGSSVDLEDDLGLDDPSGTLYLDADFEWVIGRFGASGFRYDQTGTGVLSNQFGDIVAGTPVESSVEITNVKGYWAIDVLDVGYLRFAPGLAVDVFDVDARVASLTAISAFEEVEITTPVPMLYGELEGRVGPVAAQVDAGWMSLDLGDVEGTWWDVEGRVSVIVESRVELFAGYRLIDIDSEGVADGQGFEADLRLDGWYVGGGIRF